MRRSALLTALLFVTACGETVTEVVDMSPTLSVVASDINETLAAEGAGYELLVAEYLTAGEGDELGRTVFFSNVGNQQLGAHFVAGDARRIWSPDPSDIGYVNDLDDGVTTSGLNASQTDEAIQAAMNTWNGVQCSDIRLQNLGSYPVDFGYVQSLLGFGGLPGIVADLTHGGFLPGAFFDALAPGGSNFILGVTFTFVFVGGDSDGDGKLDTAFREIYYNDNFPWNIDNHFDVETVALHEVGHGLSQGHFGTAFITPRGQVQFSPRAVMNASYSGIQTEVGSTDNGGHCSIWDDWSQ
jgi:hypothetical protein